MGRQSVGAPLPPGPFDLSPAMCYAQKPLCGAALPGSQVEDIESGQPMGQNLVIAVCPYGGCNQNDSVVLNLQSIQRGVGANLAFHTTRFDIHPPYCLHAHPDIAGGLGVVTPGTVIQTGSLMLAARADEPAAPGVTAVTGNHSRSSNHGGGGGNGCGPDAEGCILRLARAEDVGIAFCVPSV